jgi:hypothetical protein
MNNKKMRGADKIRSLLFVPEGNEETGIINPKFTKPRLFMQLCCLALGHDEGGVDTAFFHQLIVCADLDDFSFFNNNKPVGVSKS